jgi:hypothetical protein
VINEFKRQMMTQLKMSDLGPLSFYLGIEVHQKNGVITLSHGAYAAKIVEKVTVMMQFMCYTHGAQT